MSGTSSRARSSTSGRGSFSSTRPDRGSSSTVSPLRSFTSRSVVEQLDHPLLVGPTDDEGAVAVEALLEGDDLAGELGAAGQHDVERLVEHDLGAAGERLVAELGVDGHAHLAAAGEHVDGAVVVVADDRAVGRRRLGELVDLLAQRGDVVARLPQGVGELLVLATRPGTAGPWSRAAAPRGCAPAWARPAGAAGATGPPPRGCARAPGARPARPRPAADRRTRRRGPPPS